VLRAVNMTQCRRVTADEQTDGQTDRQTDGIAVTSPALAMRALRRAVKNLLSSNISSTCPTMVNLRSTTG